MYLSVFLQNVTKDANATNNRKSQSFDNHLCLYHESIPHVHVRGAVHVHHLPASRLRANCKGRARGKGFKTI